MKEDFAAKTEGNISFLEGKKEFKKIKTFSIAQLKEDFGNNNIKHRPIQ